MSDIVIRTKNLGKVYEITAPQPSYATLRDTIASLISAPFRRGEAENQSSFWALKNVSFDVKRGDTIGVIGRNGAGKSTLLKILSRITEPTEGIVEIHGRVGSLLEIGTGFHSELSGRENIFLSGAILGMSKEEIHRKFDEIVAFAEVDKFIDTPVKHYSSGMYVRLAFAVAAHLEPEILLVDEVLAVGDAAFQKKCLGKMSDVAQEGRTILFVSHNLTAVQGLCKTGCLLESGNLIFTGGIQETIQRYLESQSSLAEIDISDRNDRHGNGSVRITSLSVENAENHESKTIRSGDSLRVRISFESANPILNPRFLVGIYDLMNVPLFRLDSQTTAGFGGSAGCKGSVVCETGPFNVTPGPCYLNVAIISGSELADHVVQAFSLSVEPSDFYSSGRLFDRQESLFLLPQRWYFDEAKN